MILLNKLTTRWAIGALIIVTLGVSAFGVAVMVSIPDPAGVIHACYSNSKGDVRLVESAADCKNSETAITWNQTGPQGTQGPQGQIGPQGPAGQPRAVGAVFPGNPDPNQLSFYPQGLVGWVAVERISPGTYCLTPPPSVTQFNSVLIVGLGSPGAGGGGTSHASWVGYCGVSPLKFNVQTTYDGNLSDLVYFTVMIP